MRCPSCGTTNGDDAEFCQSCGKHLSMANPTGQPPRAAEPSSGSGGAAAKFEIATAFSTAIDLVKDPKAFLQRNSGASVPVNTLLINYVGVLAVIPFLATLLGDLWYFAYVGLYGYAFVHAISTYVLDMVSVFVIGFVIWKLAPYFGTATDQAKATLLSAFVYTPVFLISILDIVPFIGWITILGLLYGLYILYIGLPILLKTPQEKALTYVVAIVVASIVVYAIIGAIVGAVSAAFYLHGVA